MLTAHDCHSFISGLNNWTATFYCIETGEHVADGSDQNVLQDGLVITDDN